MESVQMTKRYRSNSGLLCLFQLLLCLMATSWSCTSPSSDCHTMERLIGRWEVMRFETTEGDKHTSELTEVEFVLETEVEADILCILYGGPVLV